MWKRAEFLITDKKIRFRDYRKIYGEINRKQLSWICACHLAQKIPSRGDKWPSRTNTQNCTLYLIRHWRDNRLSLFTHYHPTPPLITNWYLCHLSFIFKFILKFLLIINYKDIDLLNNINFCSWKWFIIYGFQKWLNKVFLSFMFHIVAFVTWIEEKQI